MLVLTPDFPPALGGIQLLVHRHVANWRALVPTVVTLSTDGCRAFDQKASFAIRRVGRRFPRWHPLRIGLLNAAALLEARRQTPQVVLSAHIVTSLAARVLHRLSGIPFVQYLYADEVAGSPRLATFALRQASAIVTISAHVEGLARSRGADPRRLHRIPPGVDVPNWADDERAARPTVITVARLRDDYKGHDVMIEALSRIRLRIPDVLWVVIGDGPRRERYEEMVRSRGLAKHVRFLGWLSDRERDRWLGRAHVFAMPSRLPESGGGEGFGIAYMEAAAHGLPVVAGNVGGAVDAVQDGATGILVDPTSAVAVADAVTELFVNPHRARRLGAAGAMRARAFAWDSVARQSENLLLEVAGEFR